MPLSLLNVLGALVLRHGRVSILSELGFLPRRPVQSLRRSRLSSLRGPSWYQELAPRFHARIPHGFWSIRVPRRFDAAALGRQAHPPARPEFDAVLRRKPQFVLTGAL